jgi:hypothetical protein
MGVLLVGMVALPALSTAPAVASGSGASQLVCPVPPLPAPVGCPGGGGGGGSGGSKHQAHPRVIPPDQVLSNEMAVTQFAYVNRIANVYWQPSTHSRQISKLTWFTEDGFNSVYILLRAHWDRGGREWVEIRVPGRPNGRTGWVQRNALARFHVTHLALVVNRQTLRMYYYKDGRQLWSAPVGIGKPSTPTPAGHFWIREKFSNLPSSSGYWPYAFGTADYSTLKDWEGGGVVGIHGPFGAPVSAIPGRISHGCIRLHTWDDAWLGRHLGIGTPLRVV